jgi:hypothetical protein
LPAPPLAEFNRQTGAVPLGIGGKQLPYMLDMSSVYRHRLFHDCQHNRKERMSPAKNDLLLKKFQGAVAEGDQPERWQGAAGLSNISAEHYWV